jgi:monoamine oxidase
LAARRAGVSVAELRDRSEQTGQTGLSRRKLLAGAAAGATALALPRAARAGGSQPSIAIIGGGIAGLTCALTLRDRGYRSTVYEASGRVGGRMFTNTTGYFGGQISEWGGELIDTGHKTIRKLAARYSLKLDNLLNAQPKQSADLFRFGGKFYSKAQADADFLDMADIVAADLEGAGYPTAFDSNTPLGRELDQLSIYEWIETRVPGGHSAELGQVLDTAYAIEFGADTHDQSALNLLYLLAFQPTETQLDIFGESDEKFHIRGGNQQLPEAIAADLGDCVRAGHRLACIRQTPGGRYRLTLERGGGTIEVTADRVVLALPFAVLRNLSLGGVGLSARKLRAIHELGRGRNGKLQLQFAQRGWLGTGPWPGVSNGASYSDTGYQASWEVTRAQPGTAGILNLYSGGSVTAMMSTTSPFATASNPRVVQDAQRGLAQLAPVYPGLAWTGRATQSLAHRSPFFECSYAYYRVGQYTDFGGIEGRREGAVHFCGEHTSQDFQGFMEGGASTGQAAALEIVRALR